MENIKTWSSFEQHRQSSTTAAAPTSDDTQNEGIDALYVSPSSTNISQSAATLLRQAGLGGNDDEEEFKLRFHWMRPHPSLVFQIEDELMRQKKNSNCEGEKGGDDEDMDHDTTNNDSGALDPAIETSRLMKAYKYAQLANDSSNLQEMSDETGNAHATNNKPSVDLPIEMPKLRINLASLVEPPLMSSWLPEEDIES
jgi:hypothetical protein